AQVVGVERNCEAPSRDGGENPTCGQVQEHHAARFSDGLGHGAYDTGDVVRERVGDWRLSWRFALAGLLAGLLVIAIAETGVTSGTFDAAQDRLFPAPAPDSRITLVAIDQKSANNLGGFPLVSNAYHAQVINYLLSLKPSVILFDVPLNRLTQPDVEDKNRDTNQPLADALKTGAGKIVIVCTADQVPNAMFEQGELI